MPVHDWTRVDAGIFHDFHHAWIEEIRRALNNGILPDGYYAMAEQYAAGFGPDVLTLQSTPDSEGNMAPTSPGGKAQLLVEAPKARTTDETDLEFYRRKQSVVAVRHVSGDRIVAVVEIVSPGNKSSRNGMRSFVEKAAEFLNQRVQLLIADLFPPGRRDPQGIHGEIWDEITGRDYHQPADKPLTLVAYESGLNVRCYVNPVAVGDTLPDVPLYLEPGGYVNVPLETTYLAAFGALARRWRDVLQPPPPV